MAWCPLLTRTGLNRGGTAELSRHPHEFALLNVSARLAWGDETRTLVGLHWLHCAARAYPATPYIGRACDATWVQAAGLGLMLRATLPWLRKPYEAVIGRLHAFVARHNRSDAPTPAQWCGEAKLPLEGERSQLTGSSLLQAGCFLLLSGGGDGALLQRLTRALPATAAPPPPEALRAELAAPATALIYMSNDVFVEGWGFRTTQTALVWRTMAEQDFALRANVLQRYSERHYCGSDLPNIVCDHRRLSGSCASGPIFPCFAGRLPGCSVNLVDLWPHVDEWCQNESVRFSGQLCAKAKKQG